LRVGLLAAPGLARSGRRPVTATASVPLGDGVVSVPAFGAVGLEDRVAQAVLRLVEGLAPGNLRLLLGMVRANHPWRLIIGLSKALVAALGVGAFGITSPAIWRVGDAMGWPRLLAWD
jgi:hypothetical protein